MNMGRGKARWLALAGVSVLAACASGDQPRRAAVAARPAPIPYPVAVPVAPRIRSAPATLATTLELLGRNFGGKVGISVRSVEDDWQTGWGGDVRLPQQSVSKLWVAITVLDLKDAGRLRLDDPITVTREDLTLFHQPIAWLVNRDGQYQTTVGDLLQRAMTSSDNTANDRLLHYVGGPSAVRAMIARKGLGNIRFGPGERLLQAGTAGVEWRQEYSVGGGFQAARARLPAATRLTAFQQYVADPPDGAAPAAIAAALAKLKAGAVLSPASTTYLLSTMAASRTGFARMRAGMSPGWQLGHKTGTGQDLGGRTAGFNDVGLLTAPDGRSYAVAVMIGDTARPVRERQQLIQAVVAAVVANHPGGGAGYPGAYTAP